MQEKIETAFAQALSHQTILRHAVVDLRQQWESLLAPGDKVKSWKSGASVVVRIEPGHKEPFVVRPFSSSEGIEEYRCMSHQLSPWTAEDEAAYVLEVQCRELCALK